MLSSDEAARMLRTVAELAGGSFEEAGDSDSQIKITLPAIAEENDRNDNLELSPKQPQVLHLESEHQSDNLIFYYLQSKFLVEAVATAEEALKLALSNTYEYILLELDVGSGGKALELTEVLRKSRGLSRTPIIAITNYTTRGEMKRCLAAGCSAVLTRPFVKEDLIAVMQELSGKR